MTTYHIKQDGTPGVCRAKAGNCPLGGTSLHFDTAEQAEHVSQAIMEAKYGFGGDSTSSPEVQSQPVVAVVKLTATPNGDHSEDIVPFANAAQRARGLGYALGYKNENQLSSVRTSKEFSKKLQESSNVILEEDMSSDQLRSLSNFNPVLEAQNRHLRKVNSMMKDEHADVPLGELPASKAQVQMSPEQYTQVAQVLKDKNFKTSRFSDLGAKYAAAVSKGVTPRTLMTITKLEGESKENTLLQNTVAINYLKRHSNYSEKEIIDMSKDKNIYIEALKDADIYHTKSGTVAKANFSSSAPMNLTRETLKKDGFNPEKLAIAEESTTSIRMNLNAIAATGATKEQIEKFNSHEGYYTMEIMTNMGFFPKHK